MTYDPNPARKNPIGCVTSWIGGLFRSSTPEYGTTPTEPEPAPVPVPTAATVRVRGVVVERAPTLASNGTVQNDGPIVALTLVVDDDATAAVVLDAFTSGAQLRVLSAACG